MTSRKRVGKLVVPKTKKDGTPWRPWAEEVADRLKKKEARAAEGLPPAKNVTRPCKARTTGIHGPKRPCGNSAIPGLTVCWMHGGNTKAAQQAAKKRLIEELDPTVSRLIQIRDQNDHMPSALGATTHLMNRILGKPDAIDKDKGAGRPIIKIGLAFAGIPPAKIGAVVQIEAGEGAETESDDENTIEAEIVDREDE